MIVQWLYRNTYFLCFTSMGCGKRISTLAAGRHYFS